MSYYSNVDFIKIMGDIGERTALEGCFTKIHNPQEVIEMFINLGLDLRPCHKILNSVFSNTDRWLCYDSNNDIYIGINNQREVIISRASHITNTISGLTLLRSTKSSVEGLSFGSNDVYVCETKAIARTLLELIDKNQPHTVNWISEDGAFPWDGEKTCYDIGQGTHYQANYIGGSPLSRRMSYAQNILYHFNKSLFHYVAPDEAVPEASLVRGKVYCCGITYQKGLYKWAFLFSGNIADSQRLYECEGLSTGNSAVTIERCDTTNYFVLASPQQRLNFTDNEDRYLMIQEMWRHKCSL